MIMTQLSNQLFGDLSVFEPLLRALYPEMPFYEIIRQLAQEWNNMDREIKQVPEKIIKFG